MAYKSKIDEKENKRKYYLANREKILNRAKEWNKSHIEKRRRIQAKYQKKLTESLI